MYFRRSILSGRSVFTVPKACALGVGLLLLLVVGCGQKTDTRRRAVAILPIENQSFDANLQWLGPALTMAMAEQTRGISGSSALLVRDANVAAQRGATEILRPIVSKSPAGFELHLYLDAPGANTVNPVYRGTAPDLNGLLGNLRVGLEAAGLAGARFSTSNGDAFRVFGQALVEPDAELARQSFREALRLDPRFTGAALRLASSLAASGDRPAAVAELDKLLVSLPADRGLDRSYAALELATLRDDRQGVVQALRQVVEASPEDGEARYELAKRAMVSRDYAEAASQFTRLAESHPDRGDYWNEAAYAQIYAGDRAAALQSLERYQKWKPTEPNAEDSVGDVYYYFGDFSAASKHYDTAFRMDPKRIGGFSLFKAAWAYLMAGENDAADKAIAEYVGNLRQENPQLADFRSAQWQYLRGRREEARSAAQAMLSQQRQNPAFVSLVATQLYLWDAAEQGTDPLLFRGGPRYGATVRPILGALAQAVAGSLAGAKEEEVAERVRKLAPAQQLPSIQAAAVYLVSAKPRSGNGGASSVTALPPAMLQTLQQADAALPESAGLINHALLGWGLLRSGQPQQALDAFARRVPPSPEDDGLLWPLVFPSALHWELEAAEKAGNATRAEELKRILSEK